ncbi:MAG: hypothetical protein NTZ74_07470 [Chloroflexi bacterium]|nr:hypothetical protein [Chloroflexota bacterium]
MFRLFIMRFLETYLRHRFLWLLPIAGMVAFAGVNFVTTKPTYISLAALYINQETLLSDIATLNQSGFAWVTPAQVATDQMKELIQTDAFVRSVIQHTDLESKITENPENTSDLIVQTRSNIWVNTLGNNTIVIGATNESPLISQQLAGGTFEVFLQWKINTGYQATTAALTFYKDLVKTYLADVQTAKGELQSFLNGHTVPVTGDRLPSEVVEISRLEEQLNAASARYTKAQDNLENSQLTEKINESEVRQKYLIVDSPNFPNKKAVSTTKQLTTSMIYVLVGVVLSVMGVIVGTLLDQTVRFPDDVSTALELPVFAVFPDRNIAEEKKGSKPQKKASKNK